VASRVPETMPPRARASARVPAPARVSVRDKQDLVILFTRYANTLPILTLPGDSGASALRVTGSVWSPKAIGTMSEPVIADVD
jgi:hypothetical protein